MPERVQRKAAPITVEQLKSSLAIDEDALDDCLMEQPDLYYHVAEGFAMAVARRDQAKLQLEETTAELDGQYRQQALAAEEKLTEAALTRKLTATPRLQILERGLLDLKAEADRWQALKEAFQQRSFMLRELVQMMVSRLGNLSLERSVDHARGELGEANRRALGEMRRPGR